MKLCIRWVILTVALSLPGLPLASANPLSLESATKEPNYNSAFEGYVKDEDFEAGGWAGANERVGEIGGWRTYLRQAQEPIDNTKSPGNAEDSGQREGPGSNEASQEGTRR
ncbi:MAG: hypothetical protein AB8C46_18485 [Burkholderiaceae bacterium]